MLHFLWVPIVYKLAPIMLGTLCLNTFVNKSGRNSGVPIPVLRKAAQHAYHVVHGNAVRARLYASKKPSLADEVSDYYEHLAYCAHAIHEILSNSIDESTARTRHPKICNILLDEPWIPG